MSAVDDATLRGLADQLWEAEATRRVIPQPTGAINGLTVDDAYRVQGFNLDRRIAAGERLVGRKVGLTSLAMQRQLGVDEPDFGAITDAMVIPSNGEVDVDVLIQPKLEAEYAFRIDGALPPSPTIEALRSAIGGIAVAIEIIDSRIADWKLTLVDTVADNASSARVVVGPWRAATVDLQAAIVTRELALIRDGETLTVGTGEAVLGDPVVALHWLATAIGRYGQAFAVGDIVLAGAVAAAVPLTAGNVWGVSAPDFEPAVVRSVATSG